MVLGNHQVPQLQEVCLRFATSQLCDSFPEQREVAKEDIQAVAASFAKIVGPEMKHSSKIDLTKVIVQECAPFGHPTSSAKSALF